MPQTGCALNAENMCQTAGAADTRHFARVAMRSSLGHYVWGNFVLDSVDDHVAQRQISCILSELQRLME